MPHNQCQNGQLDFSQLQDKKSVLEAIKQTQQTIHSLENLKDDSEPLLMSIIKYKINMGRLWHKNGSHLRALQFFESIIEELKSVPMEECTDEMFEYCLVSREYFLKIVGDLFDLNSMIKARRLTYQYLQEALPFIQSNALSQRYRDFTEDLCKNLVVRSKRPLKRTTSARLHKINIVFNGETARPKTQVAGLFRNKDKTFGCDQKQSNLINTSRAHGQ